MTDEEAIAVLARSDYYDGCSEGDRRAVWRDGEITLDGIFSAEELQAVLHFAPKEPT